MQTQSHFSFWNRIRNFEREMDFDCCSKLELQQVFFQSDLRGFDDS